MHRLAHRRLEAGEGEIAVLAALERAREIEAPRIAARAPAPRPAGRRDSRGPEASPSCRRPRPAHRRWWCRGGGSGRRPRRSGTGCGRRRSAAADRGRRPVCSSRAVSAWPSRWLTASSGLSWASAMALAVVRPTMTPPMRPGPAVAATPSRSAKSRPASAIACADQPVEVARHGRARRFPAPRRHRARGPRSARARCWTGSRPARPRRGAMTAAAVSSQEVSMPRMWIGLCHGSG